MFLFYCNKKSKLFNCLYHSVLKKVKYTHSNIKCICTFQFPLKLDYVDDKIYTAVQFFFCFLFQTTRNIFFSQQLNDIFNIFFTLESCVWLCVFWLLLNIVDLTVEMWYSMLLFPARDLYCGYAHFVKLTFSFLFAG